MKGAYKQMSSINQPCEKCGNNKWKTKKKNKQWECRNCGNLRFSNTIEAQNFIDQAK